MIDLELQKKQDKAWTLMSKNGLNLGECMFIRSSYASNYKNEYPFIAIKYKLATPEYFYSEHKRISHYSFKTENEVILANAIYENTKELFNPNVFVQELKFVFRLLGINSVWAK